MANRGGLSIPIEFCFSVVLLAVQYFTAICANEENFQKLVSSSNQRSIFRKAMILTATSSESLKNVLEIKCSNGHYNIDLLV